MYLLNFLDINSVLQGYHELLKYELSKKLLVLMTLHIFLFLP